MSMFSLFRCPQMKKAALKLQCIVLVLHEAVYLLVRVFVSLQSLHDGQLSVVLEAGRLVPQYFFQHTQGEGSDGVLGDAVA